MNIENKIQDIRGFIEDNRRGEKSKPIFWSLHYDTSNHKINIKSPRSDKNYEVADPAESIEMLERAVRRISAQGHRWILVALRTSANDADPLTFAFENPVQAAQQNGIYGMPGNGMGGFQMQDMIMLLSTMYGNQIGSVQQLGTLNTQMQIQQLKHEFEMQRIQDELEAERSAKGSNSWIDKILGNEVLIEKVTDALFSSKNEDSGEHSDDRHPAPAVTEEQIQSTKERMQNSIKRMQNVFPDVAEFLEDLARFLEQNPEDAKSYRKMMKKSS